jgi:hypothetical protein
MLEHPLEALLFQRRTWSNPTRDIYIYIIDFNYYEFCTHNLLKFVSIVDQTLLGNHIFSASQHSSWLRLALFWD